MASILKVSGSWRAQVRRRGFKTQNRTFPTKALAEQWARRLEADMDAGLVYIDPRNPPPPSAT